MEEAFASMNVREERVRVVNPELAAGVVEDVGERAIGLEVNVGLDVYERVGPGRARDIMAPGPDCLFAELAKLVLAMSAGFGLSLPLRELDDRV